MGRSTGEKISLCTEANQQKIWIEAGVSIPKRKIEPQAPQNADAALSHTFTQNEEQKMHIQVKVIHKTAQGFSLWIRDAQKVHVESVLEVIAALGIQKRERIVESFGPAEIIDEYHTPEGTFAVHYEFDLAPGVTIYSKNTVLMKKIWDLMLSSGRFRQRQ
ncbi:MAG: hypothetical protein VX278_19175 [Myxococcota bacterium]|nr:hypothetical protein [Myxococcota bacterium]